ncbi:MAG: hypothetical protein CR961_01850 [Polaribacter sp.]|nr:MAG: hypothetical protein CR961_01850 [Polaribacter sp.]
MKRIILLIWITLFTNLLSYSQKQTTFGIKAGLNYSSFIDSKNDQSITYYEGKVGFYAGGFISFKINEKLSLRPELLYSKQNSYFMTNGLHIIVYNIGGVYAITSREGTIKESMLYVPIILEYKLNEKVYFGFGPQLGYSLSKELEKIENTNIETHSNTIKENINSEVFEIGMGVEMGYSINKNCQVSARYNYGINKRQNSNTSIIQLGISYNL